MRLGAFMAPDRDALLFEQIEQHRAVQFPAQGQTEEITVPVRSVALVGEQPAHIHIAAHRQGGPDDLVAEAGDAHGVGAGEGQHSPQGTGFRHGRVKQQGLLVQGYSKIVKSFCSFGPRVLPAQGWT